jgi:hypothetical protein
MEQAQLRLNGDFVNVLDHPDWPATRPSGVARHPRARRKPVAINNTAMPRLAGWQGGPGGPDKEQEPALAFCAIVVPKQNEKRN